jgi:parvulin-like peptidyl-prolyl isomerase
MKTIKKLFTFLLFYVGFFCVGFTDSVSHKTSPRPIPVDGIVATVNQEVITNTDLQRATIPLLKQLKSKFVGEAFNQKMQEARTKVLDQLIDNKLILQTALGLKNKQELSIPEKDLLQYMQRIMAQFPSKEIFEQTLQQENLSFEDFKKDCSDQLLVKHLVSKEVSSRVFVTHQDVQDFYNQNKSKYEIPIRVTFSQIWLKKDEEDSDAKKKLLQDLIQKLKQGADFKTLVKQYSEGPNASTGGQWKQVEKGKFTPEIDQALWSLKPGEISDIVETSVSLHLIKMESIEKERVIPVQDLWQDIQQSLYIERAEELRKKWIVELRSKAFIEMHDIPSTP